MFENLSTKLTNTFKRLSGKILTPENIKDSIQDIRIALLEADVALPVIKQFLTEVEQKALGQEVLQSLRPNETIVKIVYDELQQILGGDFAELNLNVAPPAVILLAGLQGSGKTTTTAKLAKLIAERMKKRVLLVSTDIYRPAALKQLEILAQKINVDYMPADPSQAPVDIAKQALAEARRRLSEVVLIDTAGRLHVDPEMMTEIAAIHNAVQPIETLFVVDGMTGQDAANTAQTFNSVLPLTGVILTKLDGDARGGAALSVRMITGKPIKFVGVGEKIDSFEPFYPDRMASRILGMGDILTLVEETQQKVDQVKAQKLASKIAKGRGFDLEDFRDQLQQMRKMGGLANIVSKLPNMGMLNKVTDMVSDKMLTQTEAILNSMTIRERRFPHLVQTHGSRKQRIALGSGSTVQDINRLLKQYTQMEKMMKKLKGGKMAGMLKNLMMR